MAISNFQNNVKGQQSHSSTTTTTTTTTSRTVLQPFVSHYRVSRYQKKHSLTHLSWSPTFLYQPLLSTTIHSILPVQFTCLTVFLHNLSTKSSLVYLLVWSP